MVFNNLFDFGAEEPESKLTCSGDADGEWTVITGGRGDLLSRLFNESRFFMEAIWNKW